MTTRTTRLAAWYSPDGAQLSSSRSRMCRRPSCTGPGRALSCVFHNRENPRSYSLSTYRRISIGPFWLVLRLFDSMLGSTYRTGRRVEELGNSLGKAGARLVALVAGLPYADRVVPGILTLERLPPIRG